MNKQVACHPELVELSPSEERGESARRSRSGISFGVSVTFQRKSYICYGKPPKLARRSLRRYRSSVLLVRFAQPAKLRLRKTQAFFSAQDDRLIDYFIKIQKAGDRWSPVQ